MTGVGRGVGVAAVVGANVRPGDADGEATPDEAVSNPGVSAADWTASDIGAAPASAVSNAAGALVFGDAGSADGRASDGTNVRGG